ncbi:hypothetical protein Ade02nite_13870 [Paractinoplanes deccanensis]|uniref:VOC domain-containing protein n=1 Tax=Paractinoplanes deccanensis TaxID=113561 RepID=A0ABQ3XYC2_9ACTN|nr:VOC family protein [Actinoplanes deccanensis]GID72746.1 hypothetical protein Ade02nite_13870 [Actinoplanes deccanensis]
MNPRLMFVTLAVRDVGESRRFYEGVLGLRPLGPDAATVSYPLGHVILVLHRADVPDGRDRSVTLTLLVDDVEKTRAAMGRNGATVKPAQTSRAGVMADLYDPDGHWFSLYQPSADALTWPSARKVRALRQGGAGTELLYLFLYVRDLHATEKFYQGGLGLTPVETTTCHRGLTAVPDGVVKYDAGGALLTTHHVGDGDHAALHRVTAGGTPGVALGFHTPGLDAAAAELSARGLSLDGDQTVPGIGRAAAFTDPGGYRFFLCEPSARAMSSPAGEAIRRILGADL